MPRQWAAHRTGFTSKKLPVSLFLCGSLFGFALAGGALLQFCALFMYSCAWGQVEASASGCTVQVGLMPDLRGGSREARLLQI